MRYLLFAGSVYYPDGGWGDFKGRFDKIEDAVDEYNRMLEDSGYNAEYYWFHVIDIETGLVVTSEGYVSFSHRKSL